MKVKVLVSGFGFMGQTHLGNMLRNPLAEVVGIVDPCSPVERLSAIRGNRDTVHITAADLAGIAHYTDLDGALKETGADAAIIAVPTRWHCDNVLKCLAAGLDVFVEKPFAVDRDECRLMLDAAEKSGRTLAVGYVVRCMDEYRKLRETIISGRLGRLKYMRLFRRTGMPGWGNWSDGSRNTTFGGALFDLLSHDVDFARYCLGEPDKIETDRELYRKFDGNMISCALSFGDVKVEISGGFVLPPDFPFSCGYQAFFENGTVCSSPGAAYCEYGVGGRVLIKSFSTDRPYYEETDRFLHSLADGQVKPFCDAADAAETIAVCHRILEKC